jgi:hypothetical protein
VEVLDGGRAPCLVWFVTNAVSREGRSRDLWTSETIPRLSHSAVCAMCLPLLQVTRQWHSRGWEEKVRGSGALHGPPQRPVPSRIKKLAQPRPQHATRAAPEAPIDLSARHLTRPAPPPPPATAAEESDCPPLLAWTRFLELYTARGSLTRTRPHQPGDTPTTQGRPFHPASSLILSQQQRSTDTYVLHIQS